MTTDTRKEAEEIDWVSRKQVELRRMARDDCFSGSTSEMLCGLVAEAYALGRAQILEKVREVRDDMARIKRTIQANEDFGIDDAHSCNMLSPHIRSLTTIIEQAEGE